MKKLMIAFAAVACATAASAATINWNSGSVYCAVDALGTSGTAKQGEKPADPLIGSSGHATTAYLYYFASETDYLAAKALSNETLYNTYIAAENPPATAAAPKNAAFGNANIADKTAPAGSDVKPVTMYGMVIYVDTGTASGYDNVDAFVKVGFGEATYGDTTGTTVGSMALQQANWTPIGGTAPIPEPTSGLLLLLGVAGLSLRRKQK